MTEDHIGGGPINRSLLKILLSLKRQAKHHKVGFLAALLIADHGDFEGDEEVLEVEDFSGEEAFVGADVFFGEEGVALPGE